MGGQQSTGVFLAFREEGLDEKWLFFSHCHHLLIAFGIGDPFTSPPPISDNNLVSLISYTSCIPNNNEQGIVIAYLLIPKAHGLL